MAWADEIAQLHADLAGTLARDLTVQYLTTAAENPYSGVDSSIGTVIATVPGVCHTIDHSFASLASGARAGRETRVIGFRLADLQAAGAPSTGMPERGRLRVNDPTGGSGDWWVLDAIAQTSGEQAGFLDCTFIRASGPRKGS